MKVIIKGLIFVLIEFYFYQKTSTTGLETFFFGWGFLFMTLFLYSVFSITFEGSSMSSVGGGKSNIVNVAEQHRQNVERSLLDKSSRYLISGIRDKGNLLYLALFIINVIGYIRIMPK